MTARPRLTGKIRRRRRPIHALALTLFLTLSLGSGRAAAEAKILALGDSLIAGFGLEQREGFVPVLEAELRAAGHDVTVVNGGVSADTAAGGRARLDWLLDGGNFTHVIVALGANDMLRALDPAQTAENLDAILTRLKADGLGVLLVGMKAQRNLGPEYAAEFDAIYPRLAAKHGVALYPFFLEGVAVDPNLNQEDGLHPSAEGVKVIVANMLPYVLVLIGAAQETE